MAYQIVEITDHAWTLISDVQIIFQIRATGTGQSFVDEGQTAPSEDVNLKHQMVVTHNKSFTFTPTIENDKFFIKLHKETPTPAVIVFQVL